MKLTSFRDKDRVHLRDLMEVGLVDASWLTRVPAALRSRLQELLDNPKVNHLSWSLLQTWCSILCKQTVFF